MLISKAIERDVSLRLPKLTGGDLNIALPNGADKVLVLTCNRNAKEKNHKSYRQNTIVGAEYCTYSFSSQNPEAINVPRRNGSGKRRPEVTQFVNVQNVR